MTIKARQDLVKTFNVDFTSTQEDKRYQGTFTIQKLGIRGLAAKNVRRSQLNGGLYYDSENPGHGVDAETDYINNMIAHLEQAVKQSPNWWNLDDLVDMNLAVAVFKEVLEFENSFLRRQDKRGEVAGNTSQGSGTTNLQASNTGGTVSAVVGEEVQSALEP